jgi:chromosome partitioning protein
MEEKVMKDCKVLALCSQKGGVGKTTSCVNLAVGLAKAGKKVLVIDNDPQGSMTASLGYHNPDELPITLATILTKIVEDEPFENTLGILHHQEGILRNGSITCKYYEQGTCLKTIYRKNER